MILNNDFILNYNNNIFHIYLDSNKITIENDHKCLYLLNNVQEFSLRYKKDLLYILCTFLDRSIKLCIFSLADFKLISQYNISFELPINNIINNLNIEFLNHNVFIFFRTFNSSTNLNTIYYSNLNLQFSPIIFYKNQCFIYEKPYDICCDNKYIYIITWSTYEKCTLALYMIDEHDIVHITNKKIDNIYNFSLINTDNCNVLFLSYCKNKNIYSKILLFKNESINVITNPLEKYQIIKPLVSFYKNSFYIYWVKNNKINTLYSSDFINWNHKYSIINCDKELYPCSMINSNNNFILRFFHKRNPSISNKITNNNLVTNNTTTNSEILILKRKLLESNKNLLKKDKHIHELEQYILDNEKKFNIHSYIKDMDIDYLYIQDLLLLLDEKNALINNLISLINKTRK